VTPYGSLWEVSARRVPNQTCGTLVRPDLVVLGVATWQTRHQHRNQGDPQVEAEVNPKVMDVVVKLIGIQPSGSCGIEIVGGIQRLNEIQRCYLDKKDHGYSLKEAVSPRLGDECGQGAEPPMNTVYNVMNVPIMTLAWDNTCLVDAPLVQTVL
jgi:hypothetical protein